MTTNLSNVQEILRVKYMVLNYCYKEIKIFQIENNLKKKKIKANKKYPNYRSKFFNLFNYLIDSKY